MPPTTTTTTSHWFFSFVFPGLECTKGYLGMSQAINWSCIGSGLLSRSVAEHGLKEHKLREYPSLLSYLGARIGCLHLCQVSSSDTFSQTRWMGWAAASPCPSKPHHGHNCPLNWSGGSVIFVCLYCIPLPSFVRLPLSHRWHLTVPSGVGDMGVIWSEIDQPDAFFWNLSLELRGSEWQECPALTIN
jgi:hypothetical protein